jgi:hypothetical protein
MPGPVIGSNCLVHAHEADNGGLRELRSKSIQEGGSAVQVLLWGEGTSVPRMFRGKDRAHDLPTQDRCRFGQRATSEYVVSTMFPTYNSPAWVRNW